MRWQHQMLKRVLGGRSRHIKRRLLDAYLWLHESRKIQILVKKATVDVLGCDFSQPHLFVQRNNCTLLGAICFVYVCNMLQGETSYGVGSDVVHSLELGNARALCSGMNNR